jgi:DHA3 family macrolide efflux protein-like MFS transporter
MNNTGALPDNRWGRPFFTIWSGQAISLLGSQLVQFALIWWLTRTTGSATVLAVASLVGLLPQVLLGPFIGAWVDRANRRLVMMVADSTVALATLLLAALFALGWAQIWHVYLLMLVRAVAGGFHFPAMQASTTLMVPKEHLARIQGLNQMLHGGLNILAAPLGALLLELLDVQGVLFIDVFTAMLAVAPLFFIAVPQPERLAEAAGSSFWEDFRSGLRYTLGWPGLVIIGVMAALINLLLAPASALIPILVTQHFNGQAWQLAWMQTASGVGVIAGGLALSVWGGFKRRILTSMLGLLGIGAGSILMGLTPAPAFLLGVGAMFLLGFFLPVANGPLLAAVQATVEPAMQGRVFTLIGSVSAGMAPLGLLIAGPVADRLGVLTWYLLGGVVCLLMGVLGFFIPAVVHLEDHGKASPPEAEAPTLEPALAPVEATELDDPVIHIR